MAPYSWAIQKANGTGWFVSKLTGDGIFVVIFAHTMHEFSASRDEMMTVYTDITPPPNRQFVPFLPCP